MNYAPLTFSLVHLLPSPPSLCQSTVYCIQTVCCWATELPYHSKQKLRRERGLRQINTCRKVPLHFNFFKTFGIAFYQSNLSPVRTLRIITCLSEVLVGLGLVKKLRGHESDYLVIPQQNVQRILKNNPKCL